MTTVNKTSAVGQNLKQEWVSLNSLKRRWSLTTWRQVLSKLTKEGRVVANQDGWLKVEWK